MKQKTSIEFLTPFPSIDGVYTELKQLFTNLLSNAIKFRSRKEQPIIQISAVEVSADEKQRLVLSHEERFFAFIIKDNGIGFDQEHAQTIFKVFQRLHGKAEYPGTGIGLSICKKIVENHKGTIFAHSSPGVGSTFTAILPEKHF